MSETTPNNGIKCNTCLAIFPNSDAIKEHYRGKFSILILCLLYFFLFYLN